MKIKHLLLCIIITLSCSFAQDSNSYEFEFLPNGLNFMPLKANHQEARIGVLYYTNNANLKVDIGNTIDLLGLNFQSRSRLTAAIEFMAYALSTSYKGNRLQIDAVDGFFGGNLSYSKLLENAETHPDKLLARLRIIHNSAHFVDGHYDTSLDQWINNQGPIPYTEDFGELTVAHEINSPQYSFRYYGGFSYSTLVRPANIKRYNALLGFEFAFTGFPGNISGKKSNVFVSSFITTDGTDKYMVNQHSMAGVKLGNWDGKGILLYFSYYTGGDVFGAYFKRKISKFGIGFSIDFL